MYKIIDIYWERANLHFVLDRKIDEDVFLIRKTQEIKLDVYKENEVVINVSNTPEGTMLPQAKWRLLAEYSDIVLDSSLINSLADKSRNFMYRKEKYAYLVNLAIDSNLHVNIKPKFMMVNYNPSRFYRLAESRTARGQLSIIAKRIGVFGFNVFYRIVRLFKIGKKNILFLTENSNELNWNLKILYDYLKNDKYKIRVFADDKFSGKKSILTFIKETFIIAQSDIIFIDNYTPLLTHLNLSKKVKLVQLWHAGVGFKSVGYARFGISGSPHPYKSCHRKYTDAIVDQEKLIDVYKEVFGVKKEIFKSYGMPRLDGYLAKDKIEKVTNSLFEINPHLKDNKVILFSPTYRGLGSKSAYYNYSLINLDEIYDFCFKNNFLFVVKMHPFIKKNIEIPEEYKDKIFDYSEFDINDLIYVSDVMITDYSSCAYEFSLFNRPLIFYRFDKEKYEYDRPMHTVDSFTDKQYEVREFSEVMEVLESIKDSLPKDRFADIQKETQSDICKKIKEEIIGE